MKPIKLTSEDSDTFKDLIASNSNKRKSYKLKIEHTISQSDYEYLSASILGQNLISLKIQPDYDDDCEKVNTSSSSFPKLTKLKMSCQSIENFYFSQDQFPSLEKLDLECSIDEEYDSFYLDLPLLKNAQLQHMMIIDGRKFGDSISRSPLLETLWTHKLVGIQYPKLHTLVCPNLQTLGLYRSDISGLKLWAPKMRFLNLQACYYVEQCKILEKIPAKYRDKENYKFDGKFNKFEVSLWNSGISSCMFCKVKRVKGIENNEEEMKEGMD